MTAKFQPIYNDSLIEIEQVVPSAEEHSFPYLHAGVCLHDESRDRTWHRSACVAEQDYFYLFPANIDRYQEHYVFGPKVMRSHNSLFVDCENRPVDKWQLLEKYPSLVDFFATEVFRKHTLKTPMVFWHVSPDQHADAIESIKQNFLDSIAKQDIRDWRPDFHWLPNAHWETDDWDLAYRLSHALCRSLEKCLLDIAADYAQTININTVDLPVVRQRQLRNTINNQFSNKLLFAKLLDAMESVGDSRATITRFVMINALVQKIDSHLSASVAGFVRNE